MAARAVAVSLSRYRGRDVRRARDSIRVRHRQASREPTLHIVSRYHLLAGSSCTLRERVWDIVWFTAHDYDRLCFDIQLSGIEMTWSFGTR